MNGDSLPRFHPAWWLPGPHLQTLWPYLIHPHRSVVLRRERLDLPDGDFLDLDWTEPHGEGLVLVLHGLEGSSQSAYVQRLLRQLETRRLQGVVMHFRGCSGEPNRLPRGYHAGDTGDLAHVVERLRRRHPQRPLAAIGYSLGGNALLKWLGESGADNPLRAAASVSVPFKLDAAAKRLEHGFSRLYQRSLLRSLRRSVARKYAEGLSLPVSERELRGINRLREFDDRVTAPLHGFTGADDYYRRASCRPWLRRISTPTLIVHASDDPFMLHEAIPKSEELSSQVDWVLTRSGGHVGFAAGRIPGRAKDWLGDYAARWLQRQLLIKP